MAVVVGLAQAEQPWFWGVAATVTAALVLLNVAAVVAVYARRTRQLSRSRRERAFRARFEVALDELRSTAPPGGQWLATHVRRFDELERPVAATMLIEYVEPASEEERAHVLDVLREAGAIDVIVRSARRRMPWRRALAIRTLGWVGADEAVPVVTEAASDRSRHVREAAVRAL